MIKGDRNMKLSSRIIVAFLLLAMLLSLFSCRDNTEQGSIDSSAVRSTAEVTTADTEEFYDSCGRTYDNIAYTILRYDSEQQGGWVGRPNDIFNEDSSAGILEAAVYKRNKLVEDKLGITINLVTLHSSFVNDMVVAASGDHIYDLALPRLNDVARLMTQNLIRDWTELGMDTGYSWWDQNSIDTFTMAGKVFAMSSDITFVDKLSTLAVVVNQTNADKLKLGDIISLVDKREWTVGKMLELASNATAQLDGVKGLYTQNDTSYYFLHAANIETVTVENDQLVFNLNSDRAMTVLQKAYTVLNSDYCKNRQYNENGGTTDTSEFVQDFIQNNGGLFMLRSVESFYEIVKYTVDYMILPMPIYDENVAEYRSSVNGYTAVALCLPITNPVDTDQRTADIIQLMGMYSSREVTPVLYNVVLGTRFAGSADNANMLNLIFESRFFDRGLYWSASVRKAVIKSKAALATAADTVASTIKANETQINSEFAAIYNAAQKYQNVGGQNK